MKSSINFLQKDWIKNNKMTFLLVDLKQIGKESIPSVPMTWKDLWNIYRKSASFENQTQIKFNLNV